MVRCLRKDEEGGGLEVWRYPARLLHLQVGATGKMWVLPRLAVCPGQGGKKDSNGLNLGLHPTLGN